MRNHATMIPGVNRRSGVGFLVEAISLTRHDHKAADFVS